MRALSAAASRDAGEWRIAGVSSNHVVEMSDPMVHLRASAGLVLLLVAVLLVTAVFAPRAVFAGDPRDAAAVERLHDHGHDHDDGLPTGQPHHVGDHSHVTLALPPAPMTMPERAGRPVGWPDHRLASPDHFRTLERPPRPIFVA